MTVTWGDPDRLVARAGPVDDHGAAPTVVARPLADELVGLIDELADHGPVTALRVELTELLAAWAAALVRVHRRPVEAGAPAAPLPGVLCGEPVPAWACELPAAAGRAWAVRAHPATRRALDEARAGWSSTSQVHGRAGDDVVITRDADDSIAAAQLLPGLPAGRGDARWDVASALDWIAVVLGPTLDPGWRIDPVADFLTAYREIGGRAEPSRALAVARTIATAVEWSAVLTADGGPATDEYHAWLAALWARPLDLVTRAADHR